MPIHSHAGVPLHYLLRGRGPATLMIHGLGSSGADWALQVPALESRLRLIVPDLPGSGHSGTMRGECSIRALAAALWSLLDGLDAPTANIVGFSLGGAVALEMALQRPGCVPRLVLINALASYRIDSCRKWLEARVPFALIRVFGLQRTAGLMAARLFPHPWQRAMRERAVAVIGAVPVDAYRAAAVALERWSATDRLGALRSRTLIIASDLDYTPLAEKRDLAAALGASLIVVRGARHGAPFDSTAVTNASLLAHFCDQPLPCAEQWECDEPDQVGFPPPVGNLAEEHAAI